MKGSTETVANILILVIILITIISGIVLIVQGTPIAQNQCIIAQSGEINSLKAKIDEARKRGVTLPYSFDVLDCVKCMWYNPKDEQLEVVYSVRRGFLSHEELMDVNYSMQINFIDIGCNCDKNAAYGCDDKDSNGIYCANLRKESSPYQLEINGTYIRCIDCPTESPTYKQCPIGYKRCPCIGELCKIINCGDALSGLKLDVDRTQYYVLELDSEKDVNITLINSVTCDFTHACPYRLYIKGQSKECPDYIAPECSDINRICKWSRHLSNDTYYFKVSKLNIREGFYNLILSCA